MVLFISHIHITHKKHVVHCTLKVFCNTWCAWQMANDSQTLQQTAGYLAGVSVRKVGWDGVVGIVAHYGLDVLVIESRWGARFSAPVQAGPGAHPVSWRMGTGSFPGVKRPGRGVSHPPPSSTEVKERVDLYLYSPSGPSWPILGWNLPLPFKFP